MSIQPPGMSMPNQNGRGMFAPRLPSPPTFRPTFEPVPTLPGYFVNNEDDILVRDIPMDDSISYFPTRDLSKIYIRQWNKRGNLECLTYVLEQPEQKNLPAPEAPILPAPPPPPAKGQQPQQQNAESSETSAVVNALTVLNNGFSETFGQFASVLQGLQQRLDGIESAITSIPRFTVDDGGMG